MSQNPCQHAHKKVTHLPELGGPGVQHVETMCRLKMRSQADQLQVYQALFAKHLEGSMLNNTCPVAASGKWAACPFNT
ncbi:hypothetical protein WDW37_11850 [Bdellovibrionota bacterium FG-1]